jgi:hypothetical protein
MCFINPLSPVAALENVDLFSRATTRGSTVLVATLKKLEEKTVKKLRKN